MIISKRIIYGAAMVAKIEKNNPVVNNVCICKDGTIVSCCRDILLISSPVSEVIKSKLPIQDTGSFNMDEICLTSESVIELCRSIPKDILFKGLLEHFNIETYKESLSCQLVFTDGKKQHTVKINRYGGEYINWRSLIGSFKPVISGKIVWNRKRLRLAIDAIENCCQYDGEFSPVFIEHGEGKTILRGVNELTGQKTIAVFNNLQFDENNFCNKDFWESKLFGEKRKIILQKK